MRRLSTDKGSVLVISIIGVIVVLSLLGATTMVVPVMTRSAKTEINYNLALQAAESGLQYAIAWIQDPDQGGIESFNTSFPYRAGQPPRNITNGGSFTVTYDETNNILTSEGKYGNSTRKLSISITVTTAESIFSNAIYAGGGGGGSGDGDGGTLKLSGNAYIKGDTIINTTAAKGVILKGNSTIKGDLYIGQHADPDKVVNLGRKSSITGNILNLSGTMNPTLPEFPAFPTDLPDRKILNVTDRSLISTNGYYEQIKIFGNGELTVDVSAGDIKLRVGYLIGGGNGKLTLKGNGTLWLYIDNVFSFTGGNVKVNSAGDSSKLVIYYAGPDELNMGGNSRCVSTLYAQRADITISGNGGLQGTIISGGSKIKITGNGSATVRAIYAPNATATFSGNSSMKGALIAKNIDMGGNAGAIWAPIDTSGLPIALDDCSTSSLSITNWRLMN